MLITSLIPNPAQSPPEPSSDSFSPPRFRRGGKRSLVLARPETGLEMIFSAKKMLLRFMVRAGEK